MVDFVLPILDGVFWSLPVTLMMVLIMMGMEWWMKASLMVLIMMVTGILREMI